MADVKTKPTSKSVEKFLKSVDNEVRQRDAFALLDLMREVTQEEPRMWGPSIVGFGTYHYKYASGREGDWMLTGFSPRKQAMTVYIMAGFSRYDDLMAKLGKHKTGKSCLYINKLEDVHLPTLKKLIRESVAHVKKAHR
jgi:hypothetical protein